MALTETWVQEGVYNSELFPNRFTVLRKDRDLKITNLTTGGGTLLAINSNYVCSKINLENIGFESIPLIDVIGAKILLEFSVVYILVFYIPPGLSIVCYETIFEIICSLDFLFNSNLIILGDFNLPEYINYITDGTICNRILPLLNFLNFMELIQCNTVINSENRMLDLVLSNRNCSIVKAPNILVREVRHHPALVCLSRSVSKSEKNKITEMNVFYNFRKANFFGLYNSLCHIKWDFLDNIRNCDEACEAFYQKLYDCFDQFVPRTKQTKRRYPTWFTSDIIKDVKKKGKLWQKYKHNRDPTVLTTFQHLRSKIKKDIQNSFKAYCLRLQEQIKTNPSNFWQFIKTKKGETSMPSFIIDREGSTLNDPDEIAEAFSQFFQESFEVNADNDYVEPSDGLSSNTFTMPQISEEDVFSCLKRLKPKGTVGPDRIPAFLLRDCSPVLALPLSKLFNICISTSKFPTAWKVSKVCPVFKKGDANNIQNYRPITIINNFSKVFEMVLYNYLSFYVKNRITCNQHGFIKGRSTVTNLMCISQYITDAFDERLQVDVVYTDFSKAFDRLDHKLLLNKLDLIGLSASDVSFYASYLGGRMQYVETCGRASREFLVGSGVPQGSILGPLFFTIFINSIVRDLEVEVLLYADDLKIFTKIKDVNSCMRLQKALDTISYWCSRNCLPLNPAKCNIMTYTLKTNKIMFDYVIDGQILQRPEVFKDLGVTFDTKMSFVYHINDVVNKCYKSLGFIIRNTREFTNTDLIKLLFFAFVRSSLEYGAIVWSPHYNLHIRHLESVQRRLLKYLSFRVDGVYPPVGFPHSELLARHKVETMQDRKIRSQIIFLYKLLRNDIDCTTLLEQINFTVPRLESRTQSTFYLPRSRTNINKFSPLHDMCTNYNERSNRVDLFNCSVAQLKQLVV